MYTLTKQDLINNICSAWKQQYFFDGEWRYGENKQVIYNNLIALGDNKTEEKINEIIGNSSWTTITCGECNKHVDVVVVMNDSDEYCAYICKKCINKASKLLVKKRGV